MLGLSRIFGKETLVGVDIGSRLIKVVQADSGRGPGHWRISRAAVGVTPPESVKDGIITNRDAVAQALKDLFQLAAIDANSATAAISGSSVIVRHVKMPRMSETVLRRSVRFEAAKYITSSVDDCIIEFEIMGPVADEPDKMGVMLVAAPAEMIESRLQVLSDAGLDPVAIDVEAFALQRALLDQCTPHPAEGMTIALLDVGAVTTDVNIITDGRFALTRNIAIAGDNFTSALKTVSPRTDWAELEALKTHLDMSALLSQDADPTALGLARAVQPVMDELLREVRRSMNYYQTQLSDPSGANLPVGVNAQTSGAVSKIVVTGGSTKIKGLDGYMAARLGTPVEIWNLFDNPAYDTTAFAPTFLSENHSFLVTGVGLAVKELAERGGDRAIGSRKSLAA